VVFSDGIEFLDVPVANQDQLTDLAVIGPLETDIQPVRLTNGEALPVGSDVYLIGYPGEADRFPQPAIAGGLISRLRTWTTQELTYFQSDALIVGGQSGGLFVSAAGQAIGISGFTFPDTFALVASAHDLQPRIRRLIDGEDVAGLGERAIVKALGRPRHRFTLANAWERSVYVLNASLNSNVRISLRSDSDLFLEATNVYGDYAAYADDSETGAETITVTVDVEAPYFVIVGTSVPSELDDEAIVRLSSNHRLTPFVDPDDGGKLIPGKTLTGSLDYPGDVDYFTIPMEEGDEFGFTVDAVMIDPLLTLDYANAEAEAILWDDDHGGGLFGTNAQLRYVADHSGDFVVSIEDSYGYDTGGYLLTVADVSEDE